MKQQDWLEGGDPVAMLTFVTTRSARVGHPGMPFASDRKLRLYACACWRHLWPDDQQEAADVEAWVEGEGGRPDAREHWVNQRGDFEAAKDAADGMWPNDARRGADLLREIVGDPFGPHPPLHHHALGSRPWVTSDALSIARAAYDGRDFGRLPVLADALEEAGCPQQEACWRCNGDGLSDHARRHGLKNPVWGRECGACRGRGKQPSSILTHLRGPGPHVRGCWATDLVLGLS